MHIAFSLYKFFPYGGIQRDMLKMARECLRRGIRVRVYVITWDGAVEPDIEIVKVPVHAVYNHSRYAQFAAWVLAHRRRHPVDLLVGLNKMPGLDVYYAGDTCYEEKAREQRGSLYRLLPRYRHFAASERSVFDPKAGVEVLMIAQAQIPTFRRYYNTPPQRFHTLPPGIERDRVIADVEPERLARIKARVRADLGLQPHERLLLFVGSGFIKKGLDRVLRGLLALPSQIRDQVCLCVVGRDNAEPFRRMALRLGVAERVQFFDRGRDDVPDLMFSADALVLPAYDEMAGMVILEAMVAGLPVLVSANCGYAHYVAEQQAGLVCAEPFDQAEFDARLLELLTSEQRTDWSANGRALADDARIFALTGTAVDYLQTFAAQRTPLIAFALFKYFPYGGLQRDFMKVARACVARGWRVRVYTMEWNADAEPGMDVQLLPVNGVLNHVRSRQFAAAVSADLRLFPADCVVGFNKMPDLDFYFAADPCFEHKAREQRAPWYRHTSRYRVFAALERAVFDAAARTRVFLLTQDQFDQFQRYYDTPRERMQILPPNVSADRARPADAAQVRRRFRESFDIGADDLLLLMIGSGFITKGLDRVLLAFASLPREIASRTRLQVVGEDNPKQFLSMAEELNIADRVTIFAGRDDIPRFLQGADLLLHPAYSESGGIVLLEAMIAGLPLITTANCGFAHYVSTADAGTVLPEPFEQQAFNARVLELLRDPAERSRLGCNGVTFGRTANIYSMTQTLLHEIAATPAWPDTMPLQPDFVRDDISAVWGDADPVTMAAALQGDVYRSVATRRTLRVEIGGRCYFLKFHDGVGWAEILKNLLVLRAPVVGARNEYAACRLLAAEGIPAPTVAAFAERGRNPARRRSFVVCDELTGYTTLEDLSANWHAAPPSGRDVRRLVNGVAAFSRRLHGAGVVHRDYYICHLWLLNEPWHHGVVELAVIDLHRALRFDDLPVRWRKRDLAALLFSVMDLPVSRLSWLRFVRVYRDKPLRQVFAEEGDFWRSVYRRALALYRKGEKKGLTQGRFQPHE